MVLYNIIFSEIKSEQNGGFIVTQLWLLDLLTKLQSMEWSYIGFKGNLINQIAALVSLYLLSVCDFLILVIVYYLEHEKNSAKKFQ